MESTALQTRGGSIFACVGSAEWNLPTRSPCRKNSLRKNGRIARWKTNHGFALIVCGDLSSFNYIIPCGINDIAMTSMKKEIGSTYSVVDVATVCEKLSLDRIIDLRIPQEGQRINL